MATTYHRLGNLWLPELAVGEVQPHDLTEPQLRALRRRLEEQGHLRPRALQELANPPQWRPEPPLGAFQIPPGPLQGAPPTYPPLDLPRLRVLLAHQVRVKRPGAGLVRFRRSSAASDRLRKASNSMTRRGRAMASVT